MIERHGGTIELVCDDCGTVWPETAPGSGSGAGSAHDRAILLADAKRAGWRRFRRGVDWCDACPACVAIWAAEQRAGRLL
ncbi:hypothetical protein [Oceaniradius stylonematis]|uniref:hypothetical protein n=1 Tax=Oceaniradius stylonematis TaxID=2184161 RepID=UPI003B5A73C5